MPNHVYSTIRIEKELTKEQLKILNSISNSRSICGYYYPMPKDLEIGSGGTLIKAREILGDEFGVIPEDKQGLSDLDFIEARQSFINERKHGAKDWYDWKNKYYGTKWGDYDLKIDDHYITFITAWSPLSDNIINKFAKDFPDFTYEWEEEQGFGASYEYIESEENLIEDWDIPDMEEIEINDDYIYRLKSPHRNLKLGYYSEWNPSEDSYLGETLEEAKENLWQQ